LQIGEIPIGGDQLARLSRIGFGGRDSYSRVEWSRDPSVQEGPADRFFSARLFQSLAGFVPAWAESAAPSFVGTVSIQRSFAVPIVDVPANGHSDPGPALEGESGASPGAESLVHPEPDGLASGDVARNGTVTFGGSSLLRSGPATGLADPSSALAVLYSDDFQSALVVNAATKTLLTGGPTDYPELGSGEDDTLELSGDFSEGFTPPGALLGIDTIVLREGGNYNLVATEDHVGIGETLTINAMPLGAGGHALFDGSAETDGRFVFFGSGGNDVFIGGAGDDRVVGLGGADILNGGGGSDTFMYTGAAESTGPHYDTLADFDPSTDRIDLWGSVSGFGDAIETGSLSNATFDDDLGAALAGLGAAEAIWFAPDAGDLAGRIFLIVDANGVAGYQPGEDYVFAMGGGATLADLGAYTDFFI
jgi:Ca2+-binding RTX toxin-like protein